MGNFTVQQLHKWLIKIECISLPPHAYSIRSVRHGLSEPQIKPFYTCHSREGQQQTYKPIAKKLTFLVILLC